jgi:hypothetical protein
VKKGCEFVKAEDLEMPVNEAGVSQGVIFAKVEDHMRAQEAISVINNYKLDKVHSIVATSFDDYNSYLDLDDTFTLPKSSDLVDLYNHYFDANNDQFFLKTK